MPEVKTSKHIDAHPRQVWDFISNIRRVPEWVTMTTEVLDMGDESLEEGTTYRERTRIGPSTSETEWRVTEIDPPHLQVHRCSEPMLDAELTMRVEPEGDGARFHHQTEFKMLPAFRPLGWVMEQLFGNRLEQEMSQTVENAKNIIESQTASERQIYGTT